MQKTLIVALLAALVLQASACSSVDIEPGKLSTSSSEDQTSDTAKKAGVGDTLSNDTWELTVTSAKAISELKDGLLDYSPEEGKQYLIVFMEAKNISNEDDYFNNLYFTSYVDDYNTTHTVLLTDVDGCKTMTGDVAAGKKLKGYVAWEVSPDWQELEVSYNDSLFANSDGKLTFVITPDDLSE